MHSLVSPSLLCLTLLFVSSVHAGVKAQSLGSYDVPLTGTLLREARVEVFIDTEKGGVLETHDPDGNLYRLTLPPRALVKSMRVSMTPMKLSGMPGEKLHLGVDLQPAGTPLFAYAQLDIIPKSGSKNFYWFSTKTEGDNYIATPTFTTPDGKSALLYHFSGGDGAEGADLGNRPIQTLDDVVAKREMLNQKHKNGTLKDDQYQQAMDELAESSKDIATKAAQDFANEAQRQADAAYDRLSKNMADRDLDGTIAFDKKLNDMLMKYRQDQLFGENPAYLKGQELYLQFIENVIKNCKNEAYGPDFIMNLIRKKALITGQFDSVEAHHAYDQCTVGWQSFWLTAEYEKKQIAGNPPSPIGEDNIVDYYDYTLNLRYNDAKNKLDTELLMNHDRPTEFKELTQSPAWLGEGCEYNITQIGALEKFLSLDNVNLQTMYFPGFPPGTPVPPGTKPPKRQALIDLTVYGLESNRGFKFESVKHIPQCQESTREETVDPVTHNFRFDPLTFAKIGDKKVKNERRTSTYYREGWIYTIMRIELINPY